MTRSNKLATEKMVIGAILTALVVILQYLGSFIRFGPFSISLVLIPIVIGAATCGKLVGAWLGFMFGVAVLLSGDAAAFFGSKRLWHGRNRPFKGYLMRFLCCAML